MSQNQQNIISESSNFHTAGKLRLSVILILFFIVVTTIVLFAYKWNSARNIESIYITGNLILTKSQIMNMIDSSIFSTTKDKIKLGKIKSQILQSKYVKEIDVKFINDTKLSLVITERIPKALTSDSLQNFNFVDDECNIMPFVLNSKYSDLPLIRIEGSLKNSYISTLKGAIEILKELEKSDSLFYKNVSEIICNNGENNYSLLTCNQKFIIAFGTLDNMRSKIEKLLYFWSDYNNYKNLSGIKKIDLNWNNQIVMEESI